MVRKLAEAMHTGALLDMGVMPLDIAERVAVEALIVRRQFEEVEVRQDVWLEDRETVVPVNHRFDVEDVKWVRPTEVAHARDVSPFRPPRGPQEAESADEPGKRAGGVTSDANAALEAARRVVAKEWKAPHPSLPDLKPEDITWRGSARLGWAGAEPRYQVMLILREITTLTDHQIPPLLGYQSVMPLQSARRELGRKKTPENKTVWMHGTLVAQARALLGLELGL